MRIKKLTASLMTAFLLLTVFPATSYADTLEEIKTQQQVTESEIVKLDQEINQTLTEINEKNSELEVLKEQIEDKKVSVRETEQAVEEQAEVVASRLDQAKERLQTIQITEVNQNVILSILEADDLTDFFNRAYILMTLQSAGNEQLEVASDEQAKLEELEAFLAEEVALLEEKTVTAEQQKQELDNKIVSLQKVMDENQEILDALDEQRQTEETRIAKEARVAAEKAAAEEAKVAAEKTAAVSQSAAVIVETQSEATVVETTSLGNTENSTETVQTAVSESSTTTEEPSSTSSTGRTLVVSATGYSTQQPGLSTHTAMGIDLRVNPMVIAVDPSVIPLGTMVEVPGYGVAIAGDTGGAIKGNKIDIHYTSVAQALQWGRRTITIKVLD